MPYIELKTGTRVEITQEQCNQFTKKPLVYSQRPHIIGLPGGRVRVTEDDIAAVFIDSDVLAGGPAPVFKNPRKRLLGTNVGDSGEENLRFDSESRGATPPKRKPGPKVKK